MKTVITAIICAICAAACVMPGDIEAIQNSQDALAADIATYQTEYRDGNLSWEEYMRNVAEANERHGEVLGDVAEAVATRPAEMAATAGEVFGGMSGAGVLGTLGTVAAGMLGVYAKTKKDAVVAVNKERDDRRRTRGESV